MIDRLIAVVALVFAAGTAYLAVTAGGWWGVILGFAALLAVAAAVLVWSLLPDHRGEHEA